MFSHHVVVLFSHLFRQFEVLSFPFTTIFSRFQILVVGFRWETHSLDRVVVQVQAKLDPFVEGQLGLPGTINVRILFRLHPSVLVIQNSFNHTISDCLE
jgi:hypothetical protein